MINHKKQLLQKPSNAFGIKRLTKIDKNDRKKPVVREDVNIINPTLDKGYIELKKEESSILISSFSDPDKSRIVKIEDYTCFTTEYIDEYKTKITATENISGVITLSIPLNTRYCDLKIEYTLKTGIFRLPDFLNLSDDREDLEVTSFLLDGVEQLNAPIKWEILNLYFVPPNDKICKYDYGEMINRAIGSNRISSFLDPDFVKYETECIQQFSWPSSIKWSITVSDTKDNSFTIDSEKLEDIKEDFTESDIIEWDGIFGEWESVWVRFDGEKIVKQFKGTWCEVVEKLVGDRCEVFSTGIVYPPLFNFTFAMRQGDLNYLFTNSV